MDAGNAASLTDPINQHCQTCKVKQQEITLLNEAGGSCVVIWINNYRRGNNLKCLPFYFTAGGMQDQPFNVSIKVSNMTSSTIGANQFLMSLEFVWNLIFHPVTGLYLSLALFTASHGMVSLRIKVAANTTRAGSAYTQSPQEHILWKLYTHLHIRYWFRTWHQLLNIANHPKVYPLQTLNLACLYQNTHEEQPFPAVGRVWLTLQCYMIYITIK